MTATAHAVIGTVIATQVANPALAIPLAILSHVAADLFPHWDTGTHRNGKTWNQLFAQSFADVVLSFGISFGIIYFLFPDTSYAYTFLIVIMAQLFDWLTAPYYFFKIKIFKPFYKLQTMFDNKMDKPWGIIGQAAVVIGIVAFFKLI